MADFHFKMSAIVQAADKPTAVLMFAELLDRWSDRIFTEGQETLPPFMDGIVGAGMGCMDHDGDAPSWRHTRLKPEDEAAFLKALDDPPSPTKELRDLMSRHATITELDAAGIEAIVRQGQEILARRRGGRELTAD